MAESAILDLESYHQSALEQKFRERLHGELDKWLDRLGNVMDDIEKPSGLWGIEAIRLMGYNPRDTQTTRRTDGCSGQGMDREGVFIIS